MMLTSRRPLNIRASSSSPFETFRTKVRTLISDVKVRREKYERENTDTLMKKQIVLKEFFNEELEYFKSLCVLIIDNTQPPVEVVQPEVVETPVHPHDAHHHEGLGDSNRE
jgi:hypothetical protein